MIIIHEPIAVAALCAAAVCLLWLAWVDYKKFLLPDIGNALLAFCAVVFHGVTAFAYLLPLQMVLGCAMGALMFLLVRWYAFWAKKIEGVGLGDVKFAAAAGLWLGPFGIGVMVALSALGLFIAGLIIILATKRSMKDFYLPYGVAAAPMTLVLIAVHIFYKPLDSLVFLITLN